jgi:hypothetical protein
MRKTFDNLPKEHKFFFLALIEAGFDTSKETIEKIYSKYNSYPNSESEFENVFDELRESFINTTEYNYYD